LASWHYVFTSGRVQLRMAGFTDTDSWLDKYHYYHPHEALNFLTPVEFSAALGLAIPRAGVS
jgi:transposase InsO family protein